MKHIGFHAEYFQKPNRLRTIMENKADDSKGNKEMLLSAKEPIGIYVSRYFNMKHIDYWLGS